MQTLLATTSPRRQFPLRKAPLVVLLASVGAFSVTITFWNFYGTSWTQADEVVWQSFSPVTANAMAKTSTSWSLKELNSLYAALSMVLACAAMHKKNWPLYLASALALLSLLALAYGVGARGSRFPLASTMGSFSFIIGGMAMSLRFYDHRMQTRVRNIFATRLAPSACAKILAQPDFLHAAPEREVTLVFIRMAHTPLAAPALVELLREFTFEITALVQREDGFLDKLCGASILAVFGAPLPCANHAEQAVRAALKIQRRWLELQKQWDSVGLPQQCCHFGITTGRVAFGDLGVHANYGYTALGEHVEIAANVCRLNETFGTALLITADTLGQLPPQIFRTRWLEYTRLASAAEPVRIYEVYGDLATYRSPIDKAYYQNYENAFTAFIAQDFTTAQRFLNAALEYLPHDPAALALRARLEQSLNSPV